MLTGKRFVICGLSRLAARVARSLRALNADITLIMYDEDLSSIKQILPAGVSLLTATAESVGATLRASGLESAECLLALGDDDLANLRSTVSARSVAPNVPVVMRAFDPMLADQFEQGLNVRRAFSVSALAAPAFAAAAFGGDVLESLRLGNEVIPICRVSVAPESQLVRKSIVEIERDCAVTILARRSEGEEWTMDVGDSSNPIAPNDELVFGGSNRQCLLFMVKAADPDKTRSRRSRGHLRAAPAQPTKPSRKHPHFQSPNWIPQLGAAFLIIVLTSILVFERTLHLRTVDAIYFTITTLTTTGYGDISLAGAADWVKIYGSVLMLSGGALLGCLFSYLAAIATAQRLDAAMARRAERMSGHVIVVGLGNVGYRVTESLTDMGLTVAVLDPAPRTQFVNVVREHAAVLTADARLPDNLDRVSVRRAEAIIACTSDDLTNVETCLHAHRMNPHIRSIARVYDDQIVDTLSSAFSIDRVLSATNLAESSFVMAATDSAAVRLVRVDGLSFSAGRYRVEQTLTPDRIKELQDMGVRLAAFCSEDGTVSTSPSSITVSETIVCGPDTAVRALFENRVKPAGNS